MAAEPPAYYTLKQVATLYGIHERTLRHWIVKGAITPTRIGPSGTLRLSAAEVKKLAHERGPDDAAS